MIPEFQELVKNARLTKKERLVADYVLANFKDACFITSTSLAKKLEISHSSIIRFSRALGFTGYSEYQQTIRKYYNDYISSLGDSADIPTFKLARTADLLPQRSIRDDISIVTQDNIKSAILNNSDELFAMASEKIIQSRTKYIVGNRGNHCVASFLSVILKDTLPYVFAEPSGSCNTFDFLSDIGKHDCLIVISYPRYSELSRLAAELAYRKGATVIVLTDTPTSSLAQYATFLFTNSVNSISFFNSMIPSLYTAEVLATYICKKIGKQNTEKLQLIDEYTSKLKLY